MDCWSLYNKTFKNLILVILQTNIKSNVSFRSMRDYWQGFRLVRFVWIKILKLLMDSEKPDSNTTKDTYLEIE